jgi:hypothetical protein
MRDVAASLPGKNHKQLQRRLFEHAARLNNVSRILDLKVVAAEFDQSNVRSALHSSLRSLSVAIGLTAATAQISGYSVKDLAQRQVETKKTVEVIVNRLEGGRSLAVTGSGVQSTLR